MALSHLLPPLCYVCALAHRGSLRPSRLPSSILQVGFALFPALQSLLALLRVGDPLGCANTSGEADGADICGEVGSALEAGAGVVQ